MGNIGFYWLTIISMISTLFFIAPIHADFSTTGLSETIQQKLLPLSFTFQIIPAALNGFIALLLLNSYVQNTRLMGKWLFIIIFALNFYTNGTNYVETVVNYSYWGSIGNKDWLAYRFSNGKFYATYLLPAYLPLLLIVAMFWLRPKAIPKSFILIFLLAEIWIFITTVIYFVPKIQIPLNDHFSLKLIEDLNRYDFILRGSAEWVLYIITGWMFLKIGQEKMAEGTLKQ